MTIEWRSWQLLAALSLVNFLVNASTFNSLGVVLPDMVRALKWNWTQAGLGFTILGAFCGGSALLPALLIRRFGVRVTMLMGTGVMAMGFFCLARTENLTLYCVGAALCGVGYQMMALIPGTHVLAAAFHHRGVPFGLYFTAGALGGVAGPWMVPGVAALIGGDWRNYWEFQLWASLALGCVCAAMLGGKEWLSRIGARTDAAVAGETEPSRGRESQRIFRSTRNWSVAEAVRTPQFFILLAAYFAHLLVGVTVASLSVAHLTQQGVAMTVALAMLSLEALVQTGGRAGATLLGERVDPKHILLFALTALAVGTGALSIARDTAAMLIYAIGSGLGFGLTALAVSILLLNYFGRGSNLEIFARTALVGAFSALGPTLGGRLRDLTGSFSAVFALYAGAVLLVALAVAAMKPPLQPPVGSRP